MRIRVAAFAASRSSDGLCVRHRILTQRGGGEVARCHGVSEAQSRILRHLQVKSINSASMQPCVLFMPMGCVSGLDSGRAWQRSSGSKMSRLW